MIIPAAFASILMLGCNDLQKTTEPVPVQSNQPGTLRMIVTTSGSEPDADGYVILARRLPIPKKSPVSLPCLSMETRHCLDWCRTLIQLALQGWLRTAI